MTIPLCTRTWTGAKVAVLTVARFSVEGLSVHLRSMETWSMDGCEAQQRLGKYPQMLHLLYSDIAKTEFAQLFAVLINPLHDQLGHLIWIFLRNIMSGAVTNTDALQLAVNPFLP